MYILKKNFQNNRQFLFFIFEKLPIYRRYFRNNRRFFQALPRLMCVSPQALSSLMCASPHARLFFQYFFLNYPPIYLRYIDISMIINIFIIEK